MSSGKEHHYKVNVTWTGNTGSGTSHYAKYSRAFELSCAGKPMLLGSSDPAFLGDETRWNPEDMLVGSIAACHKLWYLHLCAVAGVVVVSYVDECEGVMVEDDEKGGFFTQVTLRPKVGISPQSDREKAMSLHDDAHKFCFIANSLNFPIIHEPTICYA
jgi:organic hydroperoxide reductase OsmC/OhrA